MFNINTTYRSEQVEIMDDFDLNGKDLDKTLQDLDRINSWLGGNRITIKGVQKLLGNNVDNSPIRIVDLGCGNGTILRKLAAWGERNHYNFELTGIDANSHAIEMAKCLTRDQPNIQFKTLNIFDNDFKNLQFDIILCTLTLHHFKDQQIISLLKQLIKQSKRGIIINDLHRSKAAYILFKAFCAVFVDNEIARKDGLISILRGFKKEDFQRYKAHFPYIFHSIRWKWAFRYQWIIAKERQII